MDTERLPGSWLCRTALERSRFREMNARVRFARRAQGVLLGGTTLGAAYWYGWWLAGLTLVGIAALSGTEVAYRIGKHPERTSASSFATLEMLLAAAVAGSGGAHSPLLGFLTVPVVMLATRFRARVVAVGVAGALTLTAMAAVVAALLPSPPAPPAGLLLLCFLALLASLVLAAVTLLAAELQSRGEATVDPLTALFNRKALPGRFAEAAAQAAVLGWPVALIVCDIDHFKRVNDAYGHDRGDAVLRAVAQRMRRAVRSAELVYRLGGEEFLILLPGQDASAAAAIAMRLIAEVEAEPLAGLTITLSAGVASSQPDGIDYDRLVRAADQALYAAKRAGRNQVRCAETTQTWQAS